MKLVANQIDRPWPHHLAVLVAATTFPLIWVGSLVTTYEAGMAVPDWPSTYGYNLFAYPWTTWLLGPWDLFIEHGHRLLGAAVGMLTIALTLALWFYDRRRWMRILGIVALAAVVAQGALGGMRVLFDERLLAKIHGCFGPAFFALAVALAIFTSRRWQSCAPPRHDAAAGRFRRLALLTCLLAYAQLVVGANLRHVPLSGSPATFRALVVFHLLLAAVLLAHVVLLSVRAWRRFRTEPAILRPALLLAALVLGQLVLGTFTWIENYGFPVLTERFRWAAGHTVQAGGQLQSLVTTAHVAVGSLIVATSLAVALAAWRWLALAVSVENRERVGATPFESDQLRQLLRARLPRQPWAFPSEVRA